MHDKTHQQQRGEVPELGDGKVRAHHSLHALLPTDAHAEVSRLRMEQA